LEEEQHVKEYKEWKKELGVFQKENPSYPRFDELYGKVTKKRKRKEDTRVTDSGSEEKVLDVEVTVTCDQMDIVLEIDQ
jgi:hypothetical protein